LSTSQGPALVRDGRGTGSALRAVLMSLLVAAVILPTAAPTSVARAAPRATGWYPSAGPLWLIPTDSAVRHTYTGGPGVAGGIGYAWTRRFGAEVRLGWFRRAGSPDARLAQSAQSRLTVVPFSAEFLFRTPLARTTSGAERLGIFAAAGPALVFSRERFEYRYAGDDRSVSVEGRRSDPAGTASAGFEGSAGNSRFGWRLVLRAILAGGHREVLRDGGRSDERDDAATPSHASLGFELTWR
jgi:hypothetical protein